MRKQLFGTKRRAIAVITGVVVLGASVAAFAYFTSNGTGTGTAGTATPDHLIVRQVGAGYDSLSPTSVYHQDQTYGGAGITEFGNDITLANPGSQRLVNVVVAFRNWGAAFGPTTGNAVPLTLSIVGGPSDTVSPDIAAANSVTGRPTVTNVTFDFSNQTAFVPQQFIYGISFDTSGPAGGLNVALSNSTGGDLVVGTDTHPGTVWLSTTYSAIGNDFPTCSTPGGSVPTGVWESVITNCGASNPNNPGAYGDGTPATIVHEDIPAVEFNVVGGVVTNLSPGGPSQPVVFAITNPGGTTQHVNTVTTSISSISNANTGVNGATLPCVAGWFSIAPAAQTINADVPGGTTFFPAPGTTISMPADAVHDQDNCQAATINLGFTSN